MLEVGLETEDVLDGETVRTCSMFILTNQTHADVSITDEDHEEVDPTTLFLMNFKYIHHQYVF